MITAISWKVMPISNFEFFENWGSKYRNPRTSILAFTVYETLIRNSEKFYHVQFRVRKYSICINKSLQQACRSKVRPVCPESSSIISDWRISEAGEGWLSQQFLENEFKKLKGQNKVFTWLFHDFCYLITFWHIVNHFTDRVNKNIFPKLKSKTYNC